MQITKDYINMHRGTFQIEYLKEIDCLYYLTNV